MFSRNLFRTATRTFTAGRQQAAAQPMRTAAFASAAVATTATAAFMMGNKVEAKECCSKGKVDYDAVRKTIAGLLDNDNYDDGSYGPVLIRLAWHASGTYDIKDGSGGSNGATMRFSPESDHGANAGLHVARGLLEPVKKMYPGISYGDLWTLAGAVAVEEMGGPKIKWCPGRVDKASGNDCPPDGRLPDAAQGAQHLRDVFYKMGMNDQEIVALSGAHTFGRCHTDRSGFWGPWSRAPTTFSNLYFVELFENKWTPKRWNGPDQFEDPTGELMMLPTDLAIVQDPSFRKYAQMYYKDEAKFAQDFSAAFSKLMALGCGGSNSSNSAMLALGTLFVLGQAAK